MNKNRIRILTPGLLAPEDDYPENFRNYMYEIEDRHFWHYGRNQIIIKYLGRYIKSSNVSYLEVGCGTGIVVSAIEQKLNWKITGLDLSMTALRLASKRFSGELVRADIFRNDLIEKFDVLGLFDVLEHLSNDTSFLNRCKKYLKDDGYICITVPAGPELWSQLDLASGHKRRYTKETLIKLIEKSNLEIISINYYGFLLYPILRFLRSRKESSINKMNILRKNLAVPFWPVNFFLKILFSIEAALLPFVHAPIGGSLIVMCKRNKRKEL